MKGLQRYVGSRAGLDFKSSGSLERKGQDWGPCRRHTTAT